MKVSVVLIAYNIAEKIDSCLNSVLNQNFTDYEVIVVDDGSTDDTVRRVKGYPVKLIEQANLGPAGARNTGAEVSKGDFIIFLDGDCIVQRDFISSMIEPLGNPRIGMTHGYVNIANPESLVARLNFMRARYLFRNLEYLDFAWGGCLAIRRSVFREVGKFRVSLKTGEDQELAYRLLKNGYQVYLVKKARFLHWFPESLWGHVMRHADTARRMVRIAIGTKRFTSQHGTVAEYFKLLVHGLVILTFPLVFLEEIPFLVWEEIPVLVTSAISMASHAKIAVWGMRENSRYLLIAVFEFLTRLSWVVGTIVGLGEVSIRSLKKKDLLD